MKTFNNYVYFNIINHVITDHVCHLFVLLNKTTCNTSRAKLDLGKLRKIDQFQWRSERVKKEKSSHEFTKMFFKFEDYY